MKYPPLYLAPDTAAAAVPALGDSVSPPESPPVAASSESAPAPPQPAPTPSPVSPTRPRPFQQGVARSTLRNAFRENAKARAAGTGMGTETTPAPAPTEQPLAPAVQSPQGTVPSPAAAAAEESPSTAAAETTAPAPSAEQPSTPPSAAAPPAPEASQPSSTPPPPAPAARAPLPDEFQHALDELGPKDPSLVRTLRGLWYNPTLSEIEKISRMALKVDEARKAPVPVTREERMAQAAREGRYEDLATETLTAQAEREQQQRSFALAAEIIADVAGFDPDDPDYLRAATPDDLRRLFSTRSPLVIEPVSARERELVAQHETALAAQKQQYEEQIADLNKQHQDALTAAVNQATARAEAGRPTPPRGFGANGTVEGGAPPNVPDPRDLSGSVRLRRGLLAAGFRQAAAARPT